MVKSKSENISDPMVQLVEHAPPKLVGCWFDSQPGHTDDSKNDACGLSGLVLGVDEWVQGNGSRAFLPLTRHCASKRK